MSHAVSSTYSRLRTSVVRLLGVFVALFLTAGPVLAVCENGTWSSCDDGDACTRGDLPECMLGNSL